MSPAGSLGPPSPARRILVPALIGLTLAACGGSTSSSPATTTPAAAVCGDGHQEAGEECDDANPNNDDGCFSTCLKPLTWVSAEPHVHGHGCGGQKNPRDLVRLLEEQSFDIGSALVWGHAYESDSQYFTGRDDSASEPGHLLHYDLETSAMGPSHAGHLVLLGLSSILFSDSIFYTPKSGVPVVDWARAQGSQVAVGIAHGQFWTEGDDRFPTFPVPNCCLPPDDCCVPWELPVHAARGRLNFLITEGNSQGRGPVDTATWQIWSRLQNAGFRITLAGGSDYPCVDGTYALRTPRTRIFLDGTPTYAAWLEALRLGHAVVTLASGDTLNLRVNGARLGSEVHVSAGEAVTVAVDGRFTSPDQVEILANGRVIASAPVGVGAQAEAIPITLPYSAWLVARSTHDLTNPVYVIVDGRPIRGPAKDSCYWMRYLDHLADLVGSGQLYLGDSRSTALSAYGEARGIFEQRFRESGGGTCP
jgi:cysteine-rich repeat protein